MRVSILRRTVLITACLVAAVAPATAATAATARAKPATARAATAKPARAERARVKPATARPAATATPAATTPAPAAATTPATQAWWHPANGLSWQWQLSGRLDLTVAASVYDVDAVDATATDVATLRKAGRKAICYLDAGSYEKGRPDSAKYPAAVLGRVMDGWPDEKWLDIRRWDVLQPILAARMTVCRQKGFDGVEPDNVDGYDNATGFPLTAADQLTFNKRVAALAHGLGLAVGLKNDVDQAAVLAPSFDFAVNEECADYDECDALSVFVTAHKPVFQAEYDLGTGQFCPVTRPLGFSSIRKNLNLGAWRQSC